MISVNRVQQGGHARSYITAVRAKPSDPAGRNEAAYQAALAAMAGRADVATFVHMVEVGMAPATAFIEVNQCSRHWYPGPTSAPDVTLCFQLRAEDGSNLFSYAGGGATVEEAIAKATEALERFTIDKLGDVLAWWARGRRWGSWRSGQDWFGR